MKKQLFLFAALVHLFAGVAFATDFDFSAVSPLGHTLYYNIIGSNSVQVTYPNYHFVNSSNLSYWYNYSKPTGVVEIPSTVDWNGTTYNVTQIREHSFLGCTGITAVILPSSITSIGNYSFSNSIPGEVHWGGSVEQWCTISGLENIDHHNLYFGDSLVTELNIPATVTQITAGAFKNCTAIKKITIPSTVTNLGTNAFYGCSIDTLNFDANGAWLPIGGAPIVVNIGNNVTSIPANAYRGNNRLSTLTIGKAVGTIGSGAFENCSSLQELNYNAENCTSITSPFFNCTSLTTINIGEGVQGLPSSIFYLTTGITQITLPTSLKQIGSNAFKGCSSLTSITLLDSIMTIGEGAFRNCTSLTTVIYAVDSCLVMGSGSLPVFQGCNQLNNIIIGSNVKYFPSYGFCGLINNNASVHYQGTIEQWCNIVIPAGNANPRTYTNHLYINGQEVVNLIIPEGITKIKPYSFYNCFSILSVRLPSSLTQIEECAFENCTGLPMIDLPESVISIEQSAFANCSTLTSIYVHTYTPPTIASNTFNNIDSSSILYVLCGGTPIYQSSTNWNSSFAVINEYFPYAFSALSANPVFGSVSVLQNPICGNPQAQIEATPYAGFRFVGWSDGASQNPRNVIVISDTTIYAIFEIDNRVQYTLIVTSSNPAMGTVTGGGSYYEGDTATLTATANNGYHFTQWQDGNTNNPRTVTVTGNATYTASFELISSTQYTIAVTSDDSTMGTVTGGGTYNEGATATLIATANNGYHFTQWQDGNTDNPRTVTVTGNATYTAYFEADCSQGISDIDENGIAIYALDGNIYINDMARQNIVVYALDGRVIATKTSAHEQCSISVSASGVYIVKVGNHPARKVVVMR